MKKAALMIDRYLKDEVLRQPSPHRLPEIYIEPHTISEEELDKLRRVELPRTPIEQRKCSFAEVELTLSETDAQRESFRCLRCDLDFTKDARSVGVPACGSVGVSACEGDTNT